MKKTINLPDFYLAVIPCEYCKGQGVCDNPVGNDNGACFSCKGAKVQKKVRNISRFLRLRAFEIDDCVLDLSSNRLGTVSKLYREDFHDWVEITPAKGAPYSVKASSVSYDPDPSKWTAHQMFKWSRTYGNDFYKLVDNRT